MSKEHDFMTTTLPKTGLFTGAYLLVAQLGFTGPVHAFDADAIMKRYQEFAANNGQPFEYESIISNGTDGFTVTNTVWKIPTVADIKSAEIKFSGVEELSNGEISIEAIEAASIMSTTPTVAVEFDGLLMNTLRLPKVGENDPIKKLGYYANVIIGPGTIKSGDQLIASMGKTALEISPFDAATPMKMKFSMENIEGDTGQVPDPKFKQMLAGLGYGGKFTGRVDMDADWDLSSGIMNFTQYDITIKDVGVLSMPFSIGGYSIDTLVKAQGLNKQLQTKSPAEIEEAYGQIFEELDLRSLTVAFSDDSLTNRALKMASTQMGQPPEQLAAGAPIMISLGLAQLNMPELTQMVSDTVGKFLLNPDRISISISPDKPLGAEEFKAFGAIGAANPKAVIDQLNLQITAN